MMQTVIDGETFEIPDGWCLNYLIECTETGYYWPPLTYYGPRKTMWRAYDCRKYLLTFRTFSPNKGKKMNDTPNTTTVDETFINFYIDAEGNRVEIPFDLDGVTDSDGETTPEEATVYIAADETDHPVTVH